MKKFLLLIVMCLLSINGMMAQSKIVLMARAMPMSDTYVTFNGNMKTDVLGDWRNGLNRKPAVRNITVNGEGKVFIKVDANFSNQYTNKDMACEYQLSVEDGQTYYLYLTYSGMNNIKIVENTEKEAAKFLKNKKLQTLPDITINAE